MTLSLKRSKRKLDPVIAKMKYAKIEDIVANNLNLQSVNRELAKLIGPNNINLNYIFGSKFKIKFLSYTDEQKERFGKLVAGIRSRELLERLK